MDTAPTWKDYLLLPLDEALVMIATHIPYVVAALAIFAAGTVLALLVRWLLSRTLRALKFDRLAERIGFRGLLDTLRIRGPAHGIVANLVFYSAMLGVAMLALRLLAVPGTQEVTARIITLVPVLIVALAIFTAGLYGASRARRVLEKRLSSWPEDKRRNAALVIYWSISAVAATAALELVGINTALIQIFLGAVALALGGAFAIAFGFGGRHLARTLVEQWFAEVSQRRADASGDGEP